MDQFMPRGQACLDGVVAGRVIPLRVGDVELMVEASPVVGTEQTSALSRAQDAVTDAFGRAREMIVAVATSTVDAIHQMGEQAVRPDQVEVKFGVKFSVQGNVILANASGEANLEVKLQYNRPTQ
jgi:NTP-dependent ternary system trypsin peptidase co-occuring protein